jgi:hypothetical protein
LANLYFNLSIPDRRSLFPDFNIRSVYFRGKQRPVFLRHFHIFGSAKAEAVSAPAFNPESFRIIPVYQAVLFITEI